jgi:hypothetical protein
LLDAPACVEDRRLASDLHVDRALHVAKRVDVLELSARAELGFANGPQRHVGVAPEAAFLQVAVVRSDEHQDLAHGPQIGGGFGARPQIGGSHDLDQRGAGSIQVDPGLGAAAMHVLAGVLLQVHAHDVCVLVHAVHVDVEPAVRREGLLELADLIALGQVGIEIVLAREDAARVDRTIERERRTHGQLNRELIADGERPGQTEAGRAHVLIGLRAHRYRAAAKQLRLRQQLGVDLQPDHWLVTCHSAVRLPLRDSLPRVSAEGARA